MDPVDGGNTNAYNYPNDPVNRKDLSGRCVGPLIEFLPECLAILNALVESYGGTGGGGPIANSRTLEESLALREIKSNPSLGERILKDKIKDPKFPESKGWQKMQYEHKPLTNNAKKINVHYFYKPATRTVRQLKIKR